MKILLGKKIQMSQVFDEDGKVIPVTLVEAGPCYVTQIKTEKEHGYNAVQLGFERILKEKSIKKSMKGKPYRWLREFRGEKKGIKIGDQITVSAFQEGGRVKVSGVCKGKGFAGGVRRWGFKDKAKAHGAKDMRRIGSTGARFPQRVIKGKKMPGRMGFHRKTIKNLRVMKVDEKNNLLAINGAIPGSRGSLLEIRGIS